MVLFISSGEIFIILLFILIFFGADKIPEFTRMMGKGVREFRKATDDIKREFDENTSGVMNDFKSIQKSLTDSLTKEIAEPVEETVKEAEKTFDAYQEHYGFDYNEHPESVETWRAASPESSESSASPEPSESSAPPEPPTSSPPPPSPPAHTPAPNPAYPDYQDETGSYGNEYRDELNP